MKSNTSSWVFLLLMVIKLTVILVTAQENNLRNALTPINRHTRDIGDSNQYGTDYYLDTGMPQFHYYPQEERPFGDTDEDYTHYDESEYQTFPTEYSSRGTNKAFGNVFLNFLDENDVPRELNNGMKKRMLSPFRERMENEKSKDEHEKLGEMFLKKLEMEADDRHTQRDYNNRDYVDMIRELWNKYKGFPAESFREREPHVYMNEEPKKRQIPAEYTNFGLTPVNYHNRPTYRDTYAPNNGLYFLKYPSQEDIPDSLNDDENSRLLYDWGKPEYDYKVRKSENFRPYNQDYMNIKRKRFPVAKRSSNYYTPPAQVYTKRGANKEQYYKKSTKVSTVYGTDPKVAKDLSNIFENKDLPKKNITNSADVKTKGSESYGNNKKLSLSTITHSPLPDITTSTTEKYQRKNYRKRLEKTNHVQVKFEPLKIKKKSIDWSNYFGIDRRKKKSDSSHMSDNDIDDEWLMKRYNKIVALTVKRTAAYPLFHNHENNDNNEHNEILTKRNEDLKDNDESKLSEIDAKLKNIEDLIIDEALKYTGAHEGDTDPKEVQQVKNEVISRLATAYSLEKMRRALSEFKTSIATQRHEMENSENKNKMDLGKTDDAKAAMKKKDTELKGCRSKSDCDEEMDIDYLNSPNAVLQSERYPHITRTFVPGSSDCEITERRCHRVVTGEHQALYSLCKWHQTCYLCVAAGNEEALTSCDVMFLAKADALCQDDMVCQWAARPAVDYLRSMQITSPLELSRSCNRSICDSSNVSHNERRIAFKIKRR